MMGQSGSGAIQTNSANGDQGYQDQNQPSLQSDRSKSQGRERDGRGSA